MMDALKDAKEGNSKVEVDNKDLSNPQQFEKDAQIKSRKKLDIEGEGSGCRIITR